MPLTFHVTPVFVVFFTVAVNVCLRDTRTVAVAGEIAIDTGGGTVIVTVEPADFVGSALLMALTVTVAGDGTEPGAV